MTKYIHIDPSNTDSHMTRGYYDTDIRKYANLPPLNELIEVDDETWNRRNGRSHWHPGKKTLIDAPPYKPSGLNGLMGIFRQAENAGVIFDGKEFASDPVSRARYGVTSVVMAKDGTPVDLGTRIGRLVRKVDDYITACMKRYATLHAALQTDPTTPIDTGWPSRE